RGVAGEEEVIAHVVSHKQRREPRVSPNDAGGWWQGAEPLADLPQAENDEHSQKWGERGAEDRRTDEGKSKEVNEDRTGDECRIGRAIIPGEVSVPARREIMDDVAYALLRCGLAPDQRLGPEPGDQRSGDDSS